MEQILAAKRALAAADVMTQAAELMPPSAREALELATRKVLGVGSDDEALKALTQRAETVTEFDPLTERIDELEETLNAIVDLVHLLNNGSNVPAGFNELLERANELTGVVL